MPSRSASGSGKSRASRAPRVVITIDGPAGVGKSTTAKLLAKRLGLIYLDTGATYRAAAMASLDAYVDVRNEPGVVKQVRALRLALEQTAEGHLLVRLNGHDVTRAIRSERVTDAAAIIAQHAKVRQELVRLQRQLAQGHSIVVEGRDTGSVVFPTATYKFFLTADAVVRASRRRDELISLHGQAPPLPVLVQQLERRDELDRTRAIGPLIQPKGAILLDTTELDSVRVVEAMLRHVELPAGLVKGPKVLRSTPSP